MTHSLTVLIVEDSRPMRTILKAILAADGHAVVLAESVSAALTVLEVQRPDVILTDYNMPGESGVDLVRRIRSQTVFDHTPVFVVSSEQCGERRACMAHAGANGWIGKPVCAATLLGALRAAVGHRNTREDKVRSAPVRKQLLSA